VSAVSSESLKKKETHAGSPSGSLTRPVCRSAVCGVSAILPLSFFFTKAYSQWTETRPSIHLYKNVISVMDILWLLGTFVVIHAVVCYCSPYFMLSPRIKFIASIVFCIKPIFISVCAVAKQ
jgi:hypothetical protein